MIRVDALVRSLLACISHPSKSIAGTVAKKCIRHDSAVSAAQRTSKTTVVGTIFGKRKGRVWLCVQNDRVSSEPLLLLELSIGTDKLVHEMDSGLLRVALECPTRPDFSKCPLRSVPVWTMNFNGKKLGFAFRRCADEETSSVLRTLQSTTVGAGVIRSGSGSGPEPEQDDVIYMRGNYEYVAGNSDSESFHLINPDVNSAQQLSVFLLRTSS